MLNASTLLSQWPPSDELRVSIEEAAHLVVWHLEGGKTTLASIHPDEETKGRVWFAGSPLTDEPESALWVWRKILALGAGYEAQRLFLGFESLDVAQRCLEGASRDFKNVALLRQILEQRYGVRRSGEQILEAIRQRLVTPPAASMIFKLAAKLLERRAIGGWELQHELREASGQAVACARAALAASDASVPSLAGGIAGK